MDHKQRLDDAAQKLADILDQHLAQFPTPERVVRKRAFDRAVAKISARAKFHARKRRVGCSPREA
jgi:hypothetical protein